MSKQFKVAIVGPSTHNVKSMIFNMMLEKDIEVIHVPEINDTTIKDLDMLLVDDSYRHLVHGDMINPTTCNVQIARVRGEEFKKYPPITDFSEHQWKGGQPNRQPYRRRDRGVNRSK